MKPSNMLHITDPTAPQRRAVSSSASRRNQNHWEAAREEDAGGIIGRMLHAKAGRPALTYEEAAVGVVPDLGPHDVYVRHPDGVVGVPGVEVPAALPRLPHGVSCRAAHAWSLLVPPGSIRTLA